MLHRAILSRFLQGIDEERTNREILFMGGGAAAGKSTMLRTGVTAKPDGSVLINPDAIKGMIPEYNELIRLKDPGAAAAVHEESSDIGKMLMAMATGRGMNVTVDKVKIKEQEINHAQNLGYKARGAVATISINEAKKRAKKRGEDTGRFVGDQTLTDGHREVVRGFPEWAKFGIPLTLTDTGTGAILAEAKNGTLVIRDAKGYARFLERARRSDV